MGGRMAEKYIEYHQETVVYKKVTEVGKVEAIK